MIKKRILILNSDNKKDLKKEDIADSHERHDSDSEKNEIEEGILKNQDSKTEENTLENQAEENEETLQIDDTIKEYIPDFIDILSTVSKDDANKVQTWMKSKILKGIEDIKSLEKI